LLVRTGQIQNLLRSLMLVFERCRRYFVLESAIFRCGQLWLFSEKTVLPVLSWEIIYIYNKYILLGYR
jgi:hypothetical protein